MAGVTDQCLPLHQAVTKAFVAPPPLSPWGQVIALSGSHRSGNRSHYKVLVNPGTQGSHSDLPAGTYTENLLIIMVTAFHPSTKIAVSLTDSLTAVCASPVVAQHPHHQEA